MSASASALIEWSPRPEREREARRARYQAREVLWRHSSLPRVRKCGRVARADAIPVVVGDGVAHFANLTRCASVHACPVCSPVIRQGRADEIERGLAEWFSQGGGALFITGTMPHDDGDRLDELYDAVGKGTASMWSGWSWQRDRSEFGIEGVVRALEVTRGPSGWHPHVHALLLTARPLLMWEQLVLGARLRVRWSRAIVNAGYREPGEEHGFDVRPVTDLVGVAAYTAKLDGDVSALGAGLELARHDLKAGRRRNRTPWELLSDLRRWGDADDLDAWQEYERASKGRRAIVWSRGLKARLLVEEASDEDLVERVRPGEVVAVLTRAEWKLVTSIATGPALILDLAELGGADAVALGLAELSRGSP